MKIQIDRLPEGNWKYLDAPRVRPMERKSVSILGRGVLALIRRAEKTSTDFNVFTTFARLGSIFPAHTVFLSQLLRKGRIGPAEKELVILRVAWRLGCVYEWGHHVHMAKRLGVDDGQIEAAASDAPGDTPRLAALWAVTDELLEERALSDKTWDGALGPLSEDELLELCMLVGHYVMVAMTLNSTGVQLEDEFIPGEEQPRLEFATPESSDD